MEAGDGGARHSALYLWAAGAVAAAAGGGLMFYYWRQRKHNPSPERLLSLCCEREKEQYGPIIRALTPGASASEQVEVLRSLLADLQARPATDAVWIWSEVTPEGTVTELQNEWIRTGVMAALLRLLLSIPSTGNGQVSLPASEGEEETHEEDILELIALALFYISKDNVQGRSAVGQQAILDKVQELMESNISPGARTALAALATNLLCTMLSEDNTYYDLVAYPEVITSQLVSCVHHFTTDTPVALMKAYSEGIRYCLGIGLLSVDAKEQRRILDHIMSLYAFYIGSSTDPQVALNLMNMARLTAQNLKDLEYLNRILSRGLAAFITAIIQNLSITAAPTDIRKWLELMFLLHHVISDKASSPQLQASYPRFITYFVSTEDDEMRSPTILDALTPLLNHTLPAYRMNALILLEHMCNNNETMVAALLAHTGAMAALEEIKSSAQQPKLVKQAQELLDYLSILQSKMQWSSPTDPSA